MAPATAGAPATRRIAQPVAALPQPAPALTTEAPALPPVLPSAELPAAPGPLQAPADIPDAARYDTIDLASSTVIGVRLDTTVSSESARVEDAVRARVTRAVVVDGATVIPAGTRLHGFVTEVDRGGRVRGRARIGIRFTSIELGDDVRVPIRTEAIYRLGESPSGEATAKIGASAVVGSILGGVLGGKRGAVIGGAAGAGGGTAMVMAGDPNPAVLSSGTALTLRLTESASFPVEP